MNISISFKQFQLLTQYTAMILKAKNKFKMIALICWYLCDLSIQNKNLWLQAKKSTSAVLIL